MPLFLLTVKLVQERPSQWKAINIDQMKKEYQFLKYKRVMMKV
jgi:hypothetical protein